MTERTNPAGERFWLMVGNVPDGPFDVAQIHAKLMAGEVTWQTEACPVGGSAWLPLMQVPGLGPTKPGRSQAIQAQRSLPASAEEPLEVLPVDLPVRPVGRTPAPGSGATGQTTPPARNRPRWLPLVLGCLVVAVCGWLAYSWLRPLTPREVCERFDNAKTAEEAKRYCTLNLYPAVEAIYSRPAPNPDDKFEYTQEGEAPTDVGGYFVGFRGQIEVPQERRRVQADGVYHLIRSDGWKIEDFYLLSVDHQPLTEPVSLARLHPPGVSPQVGGEGQVARASPAPGTGTRASAQAKAWYDNPQAQQAVGRGLVRLLSSDEAKVVGTALVAALLALLRFGRGLLGRVMGARE